MSAYQLMSMAGVGTEARWRGALTVLASDGQVTGFDNGCGAVSPEVTDFPSSTREACMVHSDDVFGPSSPWSRDWIFIGPMLNRESFYVSEMQGLTFRGGQMVGTHIWPKKRIERVSFIEMDMRMSVLNLDSPGTPGRAALTIKSSWLRGAFIMAPRRGIEITNSDISGAVIEANRDGLLLRGNYYIEGHPPFLDANPHPALADFVCSRALAVEESPYGSQDCKTVAK